MYKTPLEERIQNFLMTYPLAKKIPVHPTDAKAAMKLDLPLPVTILGQFTSVNPTD